MPESKDEPKRTTGLDRRAVMRGALAVGGASVLGGAVASAATVPQTAVVAEKKWGRALARHIAHQLPEAIPQVRDIQLSDTQIHELRKAIQNTLMTNIGCEVPPE